MSDKFFFEEDPESKDDSGISWEEHTDTFLSVLKKEGYLKDHLLDKLALGEEMRAEADTYDTQHAKTVVLDIEFGVIQTNYVVHIIPIHPQKNLTKLQLLNEAVKTAVIIFNTVIPTSLNVTISLPRPDYEVKAISFVIKDGAEAWNLDKAKIESEVIPKLLEQIGKICMMA